MSKKASLAKISRPRLFGVVPRERLFALLDDNRGRPLVWIAGPPGAGKTALVASYIESRDSPAIWYQVDPGDADPASLFNYLSLAAEALVTTGPVSLPRFVPEHLSDLSSFARLFFRVFFAQLPERLMLVLDNYQEVPEDALLHEILHQAVAEVPPDCSIIAISRVEAPRTFVQLAAQGAMSEVGWDKLQLTLDEVRAIAAKRSITEDWLLKALHQQSQGWAAGITLMLERLGHLDGRSQELPSETRESVFHYFASLIFDQASEKNRQTLLSIAFLPGVTPSLAIKLSGQSDAPGLLEDLFRRRMFTDRRPGVEPVYQFHALFLAFLRTRAQEDLAQAELVELLRRSAIALENAGEIGPAMDIWVGASMWDEAVRLVLQEANNFLTSGRRQTLVRWIEEIRLSHSTENPWLTYFLGRAQLQIEPAEGMATLKHALALFKKSDDRQGRTECLIALLGGAFLGFHSLDAMDPWIDELLTLIDASAGGGSENVELRTWGVLCTTLFHVRPWHPLLVPAYQRVENLLPHCPDPAVALTSAMGALVVSGLCGDFECGDRIAVAAEKLAMQDNASPSEAAWCMAQIGWLKFVESRYGEALDSLASGFRIAEANGLRAVLWHIVMWRSTVEWRAIGWPVANATLEEAEAMPTPQSSMAEAMLPLFRARRALHHGQTADAAKLAVISHRAAMRTGSYLQGVVFGISIADVLLAAGRLDDAKEVLAHSKALIERASVYRCFHAAQILMEARCCQLSGNRDLTLAKLRESMVLAGDKSGRYYLRFCDFAMPPLFQLALEEGIEVNTVRDNIVRFRLKAPADAPDRWPWPVRIFTLGRFEAQIDGEKLEFSRKVPRKTFLLLKAIVALGGRDVPEQALSDALWNDEEGDAARNALSITVLRLRKLLGSNESVVHQGGKVSLNPELCWVDAWAFEARLAETGFDSQKVLALYGGTFLPEDEGEPWSVATRERLRGKFIDALSRYGATLEAQGDLSGAVQCYLRGIDADPIVESFHQGLMRCYEQLGKRSEAFSVYRRLKRTLSVLLGVPPSDATQKLFQSMLQTQSETGALEPDMPLTHGSKAKRGVVTKLAQRRSR